MTSAANSSRVVRVDLPDGTRSYDVIVGRGARHELASLVGPSVRRAAVVSQAGIPLDIDPGVPFERIDIGDGEHAKTLSTLETVCQRFGAMGLTRNDLVIGLGGGMVTDVAGFAAASWHRGTPVVHVSTTLVGMIDAAIGGKTGVNLPAVTPSAGGSDVAPFRGGKNLVGAFWQPSGVICDLDALTTLPPREQRCGYGEMAKYHFLTGEDLLSLDEVARVARCVEIKAQIVAGDERESPDNPRGRALLNYGHTLGHALEAATEHRLAHGEAVAVGLVFAAHVAHRLGRIDTARVDHHYEVVAGAYDLVTALPPELDPGHLLALMGSDKKVVGTAGLTFVLDGPSGVEMVRGIEPDVVRAALTDMVVG